MPSPGVAGVRSDEQVVFIVTDEVHSPKIACNISNGKERRMAVMESSGYSRKVGGAGLGRSPPSKQASNCSLPFFAPPLCSEGSGTTFETFPTKGFFSAPPEARSAPLGPSVAMMT